jgi:hypothetical protein
MLEDYFVRPETADHIRASWIWPQIEEYAAWLEGRGCRPSTVARRFTLLAQFGDWAWAHGARAGGAVHRACAADPVITTQGQGPPGPGR